MPVPRSLAIPAVPAIAAVALASLTLAAPADAATTYANCTALNRAYPHGVGRPRAVDHTSGTPVRTFKRDLALYNANAKSDRDGDGIACEKA